MNKIVVKLKDLLEDNPSPRCGILDSYYPEEEFKEFIEHEIDYVDDGDSDYRLITGYGGKIWETEYVVYSDGSTDLCRLDQELELYEVEKVTKTVTLYEVID